MSKKKNSYNKSHWVEAKKKRKKKQDLGTSRVSELWSYELAGGREGCAICWTGSGPPEARLGFAWRLTPGWRPEKPPSRCWSRHLVHSPHGYATKSKSLLFSLSLKWLSKSLYFISLLFSLSLKWLSQNQFAIILGIWLCLLVYLGLQWDSSH